jgi:hypothetical protein
MHPMAPDYVKGLAVGLILGGILALAVMSALSIWAMRRERRKAERRERLRRHITDSS